MTAWLETWASVGKPVIGMLHLPPLPGAPDSKGDMESKLKSVLRDAELLVEGGVDGLLLENFGDQPFFPGRVPAYTATHMTVFATEVRRRFERPFGINVLRNDGRTALAIAQAVGAQFIRVNVLSGARVTDQGLLAGIAHDLLRDRALLEAQHIQIFADVNVKHSAPLGAIRPEDEARDLVERSHADALIVTGPATGLRPSVEELKRVKAVAGVAPVLVGSGVSPESVESYLPHADGLIVGSFFKIDGKAENPVDPERVKALIDKLR